jgi:hypothetical protein
MTNEGKKNNLHYRSVIELLQEDTQQQFLRGKQWNEAEVPCVTSRQPTDTMT